MIIKDLFKNDLSQRIKEVIKVDDPDELAAAEEIEDYWVTDHIEQEFIKALDVYQESIQNDVEEVNIWVSGFFGSGKSSFAKVLGYILANPTLGDSTAAEIFTARLANERIKALLNTIHEQAPTLSVFLDLASGSNVLLREGESMVLPLYRELLSRLGYSRDPRLAELEFALEGDGKLDEFIQAFRAANPGKEWDERRHKALAANEASAAMHILDPSVFNEPDSWARGASNTPELTANSFADRALALLARRRPELSRIMFIVDEVGQYVATDVHRMLDLQGLAQAFQKADGRLWLTATSQETLEDVVSALAGKRVELARVQDRFPIRVDLITADIEEVVAHRVLAKTTEGTEAVRDLYDMHQNQLLSNTTLDSSTLGNEYTGDEFVTFYPLLPYQIPLFIRAVSAHRARGGAGPMFGGTNRTLIRLAQQLIINERTDLGETEVGTLATSAMAYDLLQGIIPSQWRFEIDQVEDSHDPGSTEWLTARTIALLADVPQVQMRAGTIATLLHPSVSAESLEAEVVDAVEILQKEEVLRESEEGLRLQSPEEKDWEKRRRGIDLKQGQFHRIARDSIGQRLSGVTASAAREFRLGISYNDEKVTDGDIGVVILEGGDDQLNRATRDSREKANEANLFVVFSQSDRSWRLAEELHRSEQMIRDAEARTRTGDETTLLHEERKRLDRLRSDFDRSLESDLLSGSVIFHGNESSLEGADARSAVGKAGADRVSLIYTHLDEWAAPVKRAAASSLLKEDDLSGLPKSLGEDGLQLVRVTPKGHEIDTAGPALTALLKEIERRRNFGEEVTGRYLERYFGGVPYGGDIDIVMVVVAAAVRAGAVEIRSDGAKLRTHTDARLDQVFSSIPKFRSAAIAPRVEGVPLDARAGVAELLDELTGDRTATASEALASAIVVALQDDRDRLTELTATLSGAGLVIPTPVDSAAKALVQATREQEEERIASVYAARLTIKEGVIAGRKLFEMLADAGRLDTLRHARSIVGGSVSDLSEGSQKRVDKMRTVLESASYLDGFVDIKVAIEAVNEERRERWEEAFGVLDQARSDAESQFESMFRDLPDADREEFGRQLDSFKATEGWSFETGPPTDRLRALAGSLPALVDKVRSEIAREPGVDVVQIRVNQLYIKTIRTEEDLESLLSAIRIAAEEALGDGKYFQLS